MSQGHRTHVVPSDSAGGAMRVALDMAGSSDRYLAFPDNLSCGPIAPDTPAVRAKWWLDWYDEAEVLERLGAFWSQLEAADNPVIWFSPNSASEFSLFHACVARLADRSFSVVEIVRPTPAPGHTEAPILQVSTCQPQKLASLLGSARLLADAAKDIAVLRWRQLQSENAPFRIVSRDGLMSAPIDVFDDRLLSRVGSESRPAKGLVLETMLLGDPDYFQVGDVMLFARLAELADRGELIVHGDPDDLWSAKVSRA